MLAEMNRTNGNTGSQRQRDAVRVIQRPASLNPSCPLGILSDAVGRDSRFGGDARNFTRDVSTERTREMFAASVISSVIALAKPENGRERTTADERIQKR